MSHVARLARPGPAPPRPALPPAGPRARTYRLKVFLGDGERLGLRVLFSAERERDLEGERLELHESGWGPGLRDELFPSGPPCLPCAPGDGEVLAGRARGGRSLALEGGTATGTQPGTKWAPWRARDSVREFYGGGGVDEQEVVRELLEPNSIPEEGRRGGRGGGVR